MALAVAVIDVCYDGVGPGKRRLHGTEGPLKAAAALLGRHHQLRGRRGAWVTPYMVLRPQEGQLERSEAAGITDTMKSATLASLLRPPKASAQSL